MVRNIFNQKQNLSKNKSIFPSICSVAVFKNGRVEIIPNDQGNRITPSYVAFTEEGERMIGDAAKNQLTSNPKGTIFDVKRLIGRKWSDPSVQNDKKYFPFETFSKDSKPMIKINQKELSAEEVCPFFTQPSNQ